MYKLCNGRFFMLDIYNYLSFQSAIYVAEKYNADKTMDHEIKIASFAMAVFDKTKHIHNLTDSYKNLLCCSSLLHDIGCFISKNKHHKHTRYIILTDSEFDVIPDDLRHYLSIISSSHRKSIDKSIKLYNENIQDKLKILISILRISDALDHKHKFNNVLNSISVTDQNLIFYIKSNDFQRTLVRFNIKNQLFNKIFKIQARLEPQVTYH